MNKIQNHVKEQKVVLIKRWQKNEIDKAKKYWKKQAAKKITKHKRQNPKTKN